MKRLMITIAVILTVILHMTAAVSAESVRTKEENTMADAMTSTTEYEQVQTAEPIRKIVRLDWHDDGDPNREGHYMAQFIGAGETLYMAEAYYTPGVKYAWQLAFSPAMFPLKVVAWAEMPERYIMPKPKKGGK